MIHAKGLARSFQTKRGTVEAVRGVDFQVSAGEIVGFLGPNGAGKTTTLRLLTTLLRPTSGTAEVAGCNLISDPEAVRCKIGYVAQGGSAAPDATVTEELIYQARLYRINKTEAARRAEQLCKELDLAGLESRRSSTLSGGQRRRLDIALGLVHSPPLVFLDEPTVGLDPQARANLWDHIRRLRDKSNTTIFLTTHYLDEADALCDRILVIDHGKIVAEGTPEELKRQVSGDVIHVELSSELEKARKICSALPGIRKAVLSEETLHLNVDDGGQAMMNVLRALDTAQVPLTSIQLSRPTLDDVFLTLTGRSLRDDEIAKTGK
ncbi:ATP-binding cassette domain-containing protein [Telmatocola sphagniphila]|uniref:ATP-binding cassette domain-containing protein n=1 Tax=Telmatocola sphagniphila TaxID=1123043 RepID=A0A8E6EUW7_9BACT|nr:ATP-binding cassette domain-containing protein [Telmatocola sphagniphila]QVL34174.1 ATP-binding cassette domain-containing protein [Telmatocola sphagniphila]